MYTEQRPNQQIVPRTEYLVENYGKKIFLVGSDYVFPRTANEIIKSKQKD